MASKSDRLDPALLSSNPRATLPMWTRFAPIVEKAMAQHPKPFLYRPSGLAPGTVLIGIRDAIRGAIAFDYYGDAVRTSALATFFDEVIIKQLGDSIYIGQRNKIPKTVSPLIPADGDTVAPLTFPSLSFEEVAAFTLLLSNGRLSGPVRITNPPDLSLLPERTNCEVIPAADGSVTLL